MENKEMIELLEKRKSAFMSVFSSENGKQCLEILEQMFFINEPTFVVDGRSHAYNEGQRSVVLFIKNTMSLNIEKMKEKELSNESGQS